MAKGSVFVGKVTGSAGNFTFSIDRGVQIVKSKISQQTNPSTLAQVIRRSAFKWCSLFYSMCEPILNHSFTIRKSNETSRAKFISSNIDSCPLVSAEQDIWSSYPDTYYVTIDDTKYLAIVEPYPVLTSNGSLKEIYSTFDQSESTNSANITSNIAYSGVTFQPATYMAIASGYVDSTSWWTNDGGVTVSEETVAASMLRMNGLEIGEMLTICFVIAKLNSDFDDSYGAASYPYLFAYVRIKLTGTHTVEITTSDSNITYGYLNEIGDSRTLSLLYFNYGDASGETYELTGGLAIRSSYNSTDGWKCSPSYMRISNSLKVDILTRDVATEDAMEELGWSIGELSELDPESV